jgi:Rrf2 family protein
MLRLSTRGQYGVRAMFEIAKGHPSETTNIKEISERQEVSVPYLEQILNTLRRAGLISSVKGPGGGYQLSHSPGKISIGSILKELEGLEGFLGTITLDDLLKEESRLKRAANGPHGKAAGRTGRKGTRTAAI